MNTYGVVNQTVGVAHRLACEDVLNWYRALYAELNVNQVIPMFSYPYNLISHFCV